MKANITKEAAGLLGVVAALSRRAWRVESAGGAVWLVA